MKDENSVPTAQKMTDVSLSIFRSKIQKNADSDDRLHECSGTRLITSKTKDAVSQEVDYLRKYREKAAREQKHS